MRRLAWSTPPTSQTTWIIASADLEVRLYAVMLEQDDIGILLLQRCARNARVRPVHPA